MANFVTLIRLPLLVIYLLMLYYGTPTVQLIAVPFLFVAIMLDTADGMIARRRDETSLIGSVLDMATDRIYELVLWVALADLGTIPAAIPLIVIIRTTLTDAFRSVGVRKGLAPFEQQYSRAGSFLVSSPWMRSGYSVSKILAFCGLTAGYAMSQIPSLQPASDTVLSFFNIVAWIAVIICVVRGAPVISSGLAQLRRPEPEPVPEPRDTQLAH